LTSAAAHGQTAESHNQVEILATSSMRSAPVVSDKSAPSGTAAALAVAAGAAMRGLCESEKFYLE
jgi:hypothetical protein